MIVQTLKMYTGDTGPEKSLVLFRHHVPAWMRISRLDLCIDMDTVVYDDYHFLITDQHNMSE